MVYRILQTTRIAVVTIAVLTSLFCSARVLVVSADTAPHCLFDLGVCGDVNCVENGGECVGGASDCECVLPAQ